eukprot:gene16906-21557_t
MRGLREMRASVSSSAGIRTRNGLVLIAGLLTATLCPGAASARDAFAEDAFSTYKANVGNGKYIFNAAGCGACHGSGDETELLSGGMEMNT